MRLWKRKKPADFAEILAGLDRWDRKDGKTLAEALGTRLAQGFASHRSRLALLSQLRNRLGRGLTSLAGRWRRGKNGLGSQSAAARADGPADQAKPATSSDAPLAALSPAQAKPAQTEDEIIAHELGLGKALTKGDLQRIRRDFAKKNHPDRCAPSQRMRAARRMSIANMLIDARLKQWRSQQ